MHQEEEVQTWLTGMEIESMYSATTEAAARGKLEELKLLLESGYQICNTAFFAAWHFDRKDVLHFLSVKRILPKIGVAAIALNNFEILKLAYEHGNALDSEVFNAALQFGGELDPRIIPYLRLFGFSDRWTFWNALHEEHVETLRFLLGKPMNPDWRSRFIRDNSDQLEALGFGDFFQAEEVRNESGNKGLPRIRGI